MTKIVLSVDRDPRFNPKVGGGGLQISIRSVDEDGGSIGYRILGPKYAGHSKNITEYVLTQRDADEIRRYLDMIDAEERVHLVPVTGSVNGGEG